MTISTKSYNYRKNKRAILLLLVPPLALYTLFQVLPILQSFVFSVFQWNGLARSPLKFVGLQNFVDLANNAYFPGALLNTIQFVVVSTITQLTVAFLLALALSRKFRGYRIFKTVFFTPQVLTLTSVSVMWYFILYPGTGPLTSFLNTVGLGSLAKNWLVDRQTALTTVILVNSWIAIGFYMVLFISAMSSINQEILEAADIDGSLGVRRIIDLIIPLIWDVIQVAIVLQITGNLKIFEFVYIMTKGGPDGLTNTLGTLLYNEAFEYQHFGMGSAISVIIFGISIIVTILSLRVLRREAI